MTQGKSTSTSSLQTLLYLPVSNHCLAFILPLSTHSKARAGTWLSFPARLEGEGRARVVHRDPPWARGERGKVMPTECFPLKVTVISVVDLALNRLYMPGLCSSRRWRGVLVLQWAEYHRGQGAGLELKEERFR